MRLKRKKSNHKMEPGQTFFQRRHANGNKDMKRCSNYQENANRNQNGTDEPSFSAGTETQA